MRHKKTACALFGLLILALLTAVVCSIKEEHDFNFGVVVPGVLLRSAQPSADDLGRIMKTYGLKTVMNLRGTEKVETDPVCKEEADFAREHGIRMIVVPLTTPPTEEHIVEFLRVLDDPSNHPVLIHCAEGQARTGMLTAVYGMERLGWTNEKALAEQIPFKFERCRVNKEEMLKFILQYRPRHPRPKVTHAP